MPYRDPRAALLALALAAGFLSAATPLGAETPRRGDIVLAQGQANPELQKRAEILLEGFKKEGGEARFGAVEPGAGPNGVILRDIVLTSPDKKTMQIGAFEVRDFDWANAKEPNFIDVSVREAVIPSVAMDGEGQKGLKELGYESLKLNAELAYKYDAGSKTIDVSKFTLDVVDGAEFSFALKLTGIGPADLKGLTGDDKGDAKGGEQAVMGLLARLNFVSASIGFKDKSIVQRLIRSEAKKKGQSEEAMKSTLLADLAKERQDAKDAVTREFIDAAIRFVTNPGEIALDAKPPAPTNVMSAFMLVMSDPAKLKQMLGLTLTVR
jgi:hypothetical protein